MQPRAGYPTPPLPSPGVSRSRHVRITFVVAAALLILVGLPGPAEAAVSISRAEVSGTRLRIEGRAVANRTITVDGVAMGTSDGSGNFRIERDPYTRPADCTVDVNDGSTSATSARLSGCTVSSPAPSPTPTSSPPASSPAPSLVSLTISPNEVVQGASATGTVTLSSAAPSGGFVVDLTNDYAHIATVPASVHVPAGSSSATFPVSTSPDTTGSAIIVGTVGGVWATHKYDIITTYTTLENAITPVSAELGPGFVGADFTDHSTTTTTMTFGPHTLGPVRWVITAGALPSGLSLADPNAGFTPAKSIHVSVVGTPTTVGTSTFTIRATDANGATATRTYSITINPSLTLAITPQQWAPVKVGEFSNLWIDGSGGVRPYHWAVTAGQLPPGMSLIQDNPDGPLMRIGGTPTAAGTFTWTLRLTDAQGGTVSRTLSVTVAPATDQTVAPAPPSSTDTVSISRAEYDSDKGRLRVEARSSSSGATLRVYVSATNELIGTLSGGRGEFSWPSNPRNITVRSSLGGSATRTL